MTKPHENKDLVIIGGGPAGLSASIYAARALLDAVVLEREAIGGQAILTSEIDNYPGIAHADGYGLAEAMQKQAKDLGAHFVMTDVERITHSNTNQFEIITPTTSFDAKSVIVAGGATPRPAGFVGEDDFRGKGVSYCATCDGMFYRGKVVYVIGGGNSAAEEAIFLTKFANKVIMIVRKDHLRAQASLTKEVCNNDKIDVRYNTKVVKVEGPQLLTSITLMDTTDGREYAETYDEGAFGVFVFVGRIPASELLGGLVDLDESGHVLTNERMETKTPGLFAAGDIRKTPLRQIITAASDGAVAATSVAAYLGQPIEG